MRSGTLRNGETGAFMQKDLGEESTRLRFPPALLHRTADPMQAAQASAAVAVNLVDMLRADMILVLLI
jgi:hypothetical protein